MIRRRLISPTDKSIHPLWPRNAGYVLAISAVIAHPTHQLVHTLAHFAALGAAAPCSASRVAGRRASLSGDLAIGTARSDLQDTHVLQVLAGALQIDA